MDSTNEQPMLAIVTMMAELLAIVKQYHTNTAKQQDEAPKKPKDQDKPKKTKKVKTDSDEPKKKRGHTGYLLFSSATRPEAKAALSEAEESTNPKDVTRELGRRWKALSEEERQEWNDKAKQQKDSDSEE